MTHEDSQIQIKRFLYGEMSDEEQAAMEEKFFADDELFYEIADTENRLVDFYVRGKLTGEELERFERSLPNLPERQAKIANAVVLQTLIDEERLPEKFIAAKQTFWQKTAEFFTIKTPAFGYAMGGLLVLFLAASVFLFLDNQRKTGELARLQNANQNGREIELRSQLEDIQKREGELQNQIDNEREASGDLTDELESERTRREQIETKLERLRKERGANPSPTQKTEQAPITASIFLNPLVAARDGVSALGAKKLNVESATKRIAVRLSLPEDANASERVSVRLNDKIVAQNLVIRVTSSGQKSVQLTVAVADLADGANKLSVFDKTGKEISKYLFTMSKN